MQDLNIHVKTTIQMVSAELVPMAPSFVFAQVIL